MLWGLKYRWLAAVGLLWVLCGGAAAQVAIGDLHATANGQLSSVYAGDFGNLESNGHSLGFAGTGTITGDYYNPNFLSFSLLPYYGRSQDNSDSQSITNASGYSGTLHLFAGSHFPGFVSANQTWNSSGTFGIPDTAGLTTKNNNHGLNVGWSELIPDLPTVSISYGDNSGKSSLLGSDTATNFTTHNFNVGSTYTLAGFYLNGGFIHLNNDTDINGLENGESESTNGSSNQYRLSAQRGIPYNNSRFSLGLNRSSYSSDDSLGGQSYGTTDNATANLNIRFPRLPVNFTATYSDNLLGSFEQQLISSGEAPIASIVSPESHSLSLEASTYYNVLPRLVVGGYAERTEQYYAGQNFGLTQLGLNVNYNFFKKLKGLLFNAGLVESANQQGNTRIGAIGNVSYDRYFGKWEIGAFVRYDQDVETLLVMYTTSSFNYGASIKHEMKHDMRWVGIFNSTKSAFEQVPGDGNHAESFTTMVISPRVTVSGNFTKSSGMSILTATGLVATPVPASMLSPDNSIVYNGSSYGGSFAVNPVKHMVVSTSWSRALSNTVSPLLLSNNGSTNYYGLATYQYRKLLFSAGCTKFNQSISSSSTLPSMLTSYSFGISRWFKGF
ncbi:MAG: hypothetical protein ABSH02_03755 [Candidatus Sulfotelmatobacter sp.]